MRTFKELSESENGVRRAYPGKRSQLPSAQCMCGLIAAGFPRRGFLELAYMRRALFVASFNSRAIAVMTQTPGEELS